MLMTSEQLPPGMIHPSRPERYRARSGKAWCPDPRIFPRCLLGAVIFGTFLWVGVARAEVSSQFLRGYARAVLDFRFPDQAVDIVKVRDDGRIVLSDDPCAAAVPRKDIAAALREAGRFSRVSWAPHGECEPDQATELARQEPEEKSAEPRVTVEALPVDELFAPLIADPRQPQFSMKYHYYDTPRENFNAASVSFGDYFGFASGMFGEFGVSQIGLQGAVFAVFNLDSESFDLVNADYWLGIPVSFRRGPFSFLTRIYHQSSHLGDEFLLGNPDVNRKNLSYEAWELIGSFDWERFRFYGGGGLILHSEPDLERFQAQAGAEYRWPAFYRRFDLVGAADWQASEELSWKLNRSYQLGLALENQQGREIRLMLEHYQGFSPNGQFYQERLKYTGLGLYFDL